MLIDWFTVGAQVLNFLILVWLMRRFLYQPILHAIDAREKRIADELADADAKKAEAKKERDEFQHKNEEFDQQRATLISKVKEEADKQRQQIMTEARTAADELSKKREDALREEAGHLTKAIALRTQDEVFSITRKVLSDLASTSLEEQIAGVFTRRLREMDEQAKGDLGEALQKASETALVRSAFDLTPDQTADIQKALNETFSTEVRLRFESAPDLISGIELSTSGRKVGWSITDYLNSVEKGVSELLEKETRTEPESQSKTEATPHE